MTMNLASFSYGLVYLKASDYWERGITGLGVKVGVFDEGIGYHKALSVAGGFQNSWSGYRNVDGYHATHVAGIIAAKNLQDGKPVGVAPDVSLYSIRLNYPDGRLESVISSLDYAISEQLDIVNLSIHITEEEATRLGLKTELTNAFQRAKDAGIIVVVSAGNNNNIDDPSDDGDNISVIEYLPKMPGVVAVANLTEGHYRRNSSGTGDGWVDIAAYGTNIYSTYTKDGANSTNPSDAYSYLTGTSMSAPMITGIFALYKQIFPNLSAEQLIQKVYNNCVLVGDKHTYEQGRGIPLPPSELYALPIADNLESLYIKKTWGWQAVEAFSKNANGWGKLIAQ